MKDFIFYNQKHRIDKATHEAVVAEVLIKLRTRLSGLSISNNCFRVINEEIREWDPDFRAFDEENRIKKPAGQFIKLQKEVEKLKAENENLKSIIAKELSENDEFVHVNILKEKLRIAVEALKEVRDYDMGRPYAYCVGFLQEEARCAIKKIEGE